MIKTDSDVTVNYGFNNLSDAKVKKNIRDADLGELLPSSTLRRPKGMIGSTSHIRTALAF